MVKQLFNVNNKKIKKRSLIINVKQKSVNLKYDKRKTRF